MKQNNYLLIGLGGTGCAVVRELKKKLYVEWRSRGNAGPYPDVYQFDDEFGSERVLSRIATLSVDSNEKDLSGEGERARRWRVFGETLKLEDKEKVLISPVGIDRILSSIERYPGIEPWIRDDLDFVRDITRGSTQPAGCNQIRRMGRLALSNGNSIENVVGAVADRLRSLSRDGELGAEIHIACTLAAGTGSGAVIDVIAQLQKHLRSASGEYEVFVHGFATTKDVGKINTGNFYANQYGALLELNALRLGLYQPWDITASNRPRRLAVPEHGRTTGDLNGTYKSLALITDTTEGNTDVPLDQQVENVAEFLFQLAVRQMGNVPKVLRDALTMEDRAHFPADVNSGNRTTAFIGYGVQRVAIPDREIREKLAFVFGRQFLLKLLYHNWDNGYRESPRAFGRDTFVDTRREVWHVTRDHLFLDVVEDGSGERKFDTYEVEWRNALADEKRAVTKMLGDDFDARKQWLTDFDRRADRYRAEGFRSRGEGGGVNDYFKIRSEPSEIRMRAGSIRAGIEKDLVVNLERMNPEYPLDALPGSLEFLSQRIESERLYFGELAGTAVDGIKEADDQRGEIRKQYDKPGRWAKGKHEKLFSNYVDTSTRYHYWATVQRAAEYGQEFCAVLLDELKGLQQQVTLFDTRLKVLATSFETEIDSRITENEDFGARDDIVYLVDAAQVNDTIRRRFLANKSIQDMRADMAMKTLRQLRGDRDELRLYTDRMPVDDNERIGGPFVDLLRQVSETNAADAHRKLCVDEQDFEGIFGQNIVRKLYTDYGGRVDGDLEARLRELIDKSMPMVSFQPNEERMDLPTQGPVLRRCVFVPKCAGIDDNGKFEAELKRKIEGTTGSRGGCKEVETFYQDVPEERNPTEISIISVAFFFSARFARVTHGLKSEYAKRLDQASDEESLRGYFEVHTESHRPPLSDLMKLSRGEVLKAQIAVPVLATAMGLMQVPDQDGKDVPFGVKDSSFGRITDRIETGMTITASLRELAADSADRYSRAIPIETIVLYSLFLREFREDALAPMRQLIEAHLDRDTDLEAVARRLADFAGECFLLSDGNEDDETYRLFDASARDARELAARLANRSRL